MRLRILLLYVLVSSGLQAQLSTSSDDIVISASRIKTAKTASAKSTIIITAEEIGSAPVSSVDELLRLYAGVNVNQRGGFGVQSDVGIRGSTFAQVLWMLDGMRLNDPLTAHFNSYIPVTLSEIHHIEVIRGPGALSFGPDAVGGVIHIFTKSYMHRSGETDHALHAEAGMGSYGYQVSELGIQAHSASSGISISGRRQMAAGEERANPNALVSSSAPPTYRNDFDLNTISASAYHHFSDSTKLFVRGGYDHRDFDAKYFYTGSTSDESRETTKSTWVQALLRKEGEAQSRSIGIAYRRTGDEFTFNPALAANEHTTQQVQAFYDYGLRVSDSIKFVTGLQYLYRGIESTDRGAHDNFNVAAYTMIHGSASRWRYTAGLRFEYFSITSAYQAVPQLGLSWLGDRVTWRSLIGRAYRAPDFTENYVSNAIPRLTAGRNLGNPDLRPESSWSIDLGMDYNISSNWKLESTLFYRTSTSLIDYVLTNSSDITNADNTLINTDYLYASNINAADTYGIENNLSAGATLSDKSSIRGYLGLTYLRTTISEDIVSKYISNHPDLITNLMVEYTVGKWSLASTSIMISRDEDLAPEIGGRVAPNYFVQNLRASYQIGGASIYLECRNLTDTQYQEILGTEMPSRWILGGVRYQGGW